MSTAVLSVLERLGLDRTRVRQATDSWNVWLVFVLLFTWVPVDAATYTAIYDVRAMGMRAGEMETTLLLESNRYQLRGSLRAHGMFRRFQQSHDFTSVGAFRDDKPVSDVFLLIELDGNGSAKEEIKVIIVDEESARIHRSGRESKRLPHLQGEFLMSTLLMLRQCDETLAVHDGEHPYDIDLEREQYVDRLDQGDKYYTGPATMCRYQHMYKGRQLRKMDVWLAEVDGRITTVRIRFRIPRLPDMLMKLRNASS